MLCESILFDGPTENLHDSVEDLPPVSVIVPVYNDPANLQSCLPALQASRYPRFEVLVVDDGSTDQTPHVARSHGVRVLRQENSGPATARNLGVRHARYDYVFFIDADVCVQPDTLRKAMETFVADPTVDALFGSYDRKPGARNAISQYRNLMHHFVHQQSCREAFTFWSGCGAVKRSVFLALGGFDTNYAKASIEDIEFGARLRENGYRVVLVKDVQARHMKRWTLRGMVRCDVLHRGIPWTRLLLRQKKLPDDLNLQHSQRLSVVLAALLLMTLLAGSVLIHSLLLFPPLMLLLGVVIIDHWSEREPVPAAVRVLMMIICAATTTSICVGLYEHSQWVGPWLALCTALLLGIVALNYRFYAFLAATKHPLFVPVVIPLQVLFFLYSGLAFGLGAVLHVGSVLDGLVKVDIMSRSGCESGFDP